MREREKGGGELITRCSRNWRNGMRQQYMDREAEKFARGNYHVVADYKDKVGKVEENFVREIFMGLYFVIHIRRANLFPYRASFFPFYSPYATTIRTNVYKKRRLQEIA